MTTTKPRKPGEAPQSTVLTAYIRADHSRTWPVGHIRLAAQHPGIGWIPADGGMHRISHWPKLYNVIGDAYCPRFIERPARVGILRRAWLQLTDQPVPRETIPNPAWQAGMFRVPDMRGLW